MTEDFEKTAQVEPEAEFPSPFDEPGAPPLPEVVEVIAEEPIAPPPLPEAYPETEVLRALPPEPEPVAPTARQPITLGPPPAISAPTPPPVDFSPAEQATPKKSNQTLIIVLIVIAALLLLCCCCVLPVGWVLLNLDDIMYELQYMMLF